MDHGYGGCWLPMMGFCLLWVFWCWWIPICSGFEFFLFGFCGWWLFKEVLVVVGPIWGGFKMEVDRCFDIGWICNEVLVGYKVVIGIFGFRFY